MNDDRFDDDRPDSIEIDGESLTPEAVVRIAREGARVEVPERAREAVRRSRKRVEDILDAGDAVYGVNTGFGELVDERIDVDDLDALQENLVRSHAAGTGRELSIEEVRVLLVTRLNALVKGYSGVREVVIDQLATMLNDGIHPVVRSRGSLGASGDLAPLAHVALVLIGEGEAYVGPRTPDRSQESIGANAASQPHDRMGERVPGDDALARAGLEPLTLGPKEGLALINGTQLTVGLASLVVYDGERLLRAADAAGALTTEVTMGTTAACDPALSDVRPHLGQATSARMVKRLTAESEIVESHRNCDRVQDAYSIRCLPQVHGAVRDALDHLREAVEIELNSATDNPLLFDRERVDPRASGTDTAAVLSGGNFHGAPLAHRLDYATAALADLAAICERRVDRMVNPNLQEEHLPPFLTDDSGLRSGQMLAQYASAAVGNELRSLGRPGVDTVSVSGGQEDHVSMSATSALFARRAVELATSAVAVELLCAAEAAEYVSSELDHGIGTGAVYRAVRSVVEPLTEDRPLAPDIDAVASVISEGELDERIDRALDK